MRKYIIYRKIDRYKYQLVADAHFDTSIHGIAAETEYLKLSPDGILTLKKGYCSDGPSGISIDTPNFMRGAFGHDGLYQMIRLRLLPVSYKQQADDLLHKWCLEDGMSKFRAWYVRKAVQVFGHSSCKPGTDRSESFIAP